MAVAQDADGHGNMPLPPSSPSKTRRPRRRRQQRTKISPLQRLCHNLLHRLVTIWYSDPALPPLYGPVRFAFYATLLFILLTLPDGSGAMCFRRNTCMHALQRMEHYENFGFDTKFESGLMGHGLDWLGLDARDVFGNNSSYINCETMQYGVRYGLALSAIGLGAVLPRILAAFCWWTMFGIKMIGWGPSPGHEQYLAGVGLVALCFADGNLVDGWSVDYWLRWAWYFFTGNPFVVQHQQPQQTSWDGISPSPGRAARKMVVFQASCVMFFAGIHKFSSYGFVWLDGGTILKSLHPGNDARIDMLRAFVVEHNGFFVAPMATVSVIGELSSVFAFLSSKYRHFIVLCWVKFHIGIMILMHPNFSMNMATYVLLIDWRGLFGGTRLAKLLPFLRDQPNATGDCKAASPIKSQRTSHPRSRRVGAVIYTLFAAIMFTTSLLRIDFWPFSSYALYNWHPSDLGYDRDRPLTPEETIASASRCFARPPIGPTCGNKNGSNHHNSIVSTRKHFIKKVFVTGVIAGRDYAPDEETCGPNELRVYVNLDPFMCWPRPSDGSKLSPEDIQRIMREVTTKKKRKKHPYKLRSIQSEYVRKGLAWRVDDVILASLDDHPRCFDPLGAANPNERNWMAEPARDSIGSDLARRLRAGLTEHDYLPDYPREQVLGVGLYWTYLDGGTGQRNEDGEVEGGTQRVCNVGESVLGDLNLVDDKESGVRFRNHVKNHPRDWSQVQRGILLVVVILGSAFAYTAKLKSNTATGHLPIKSPERRVFKF